MYRKLKDLYDPNKVDRGPTELRSGGGAGNLPAKQLGPRRIPQGRGGYQEQNADGSWDYVSANTGRRTPLGTMRDYRQKQIEAAEHAAKLRDIQRGNRGGRNVSAKGLYNTFMGKSNTPPDDPNAPHKESENTAGNIISNTVGAISGAIADPQGTWENLRTGWNLFTGDAAGAKQSMEDAKRRRAGAAK